MKIAVAGTGYVGMSIATLLAQKNHVTAVDVIPEKVEQALAPLFTRNDFYVSSRPHPKWGEELVVVVEHAGAMGIEYIDSKRYFIGARSLYALCRDMLAPCERPKGVIVLPEFARTDSGKLIRQRF